MAPTARIPAALVGTVFTSAQAAEQGVTASMLRGAHFVTVHRGVWRLRSTDLTPDLLVLAARLVLPSDTPVSHVTALQLHGSTVGRPVPVHLSTNSDRQLRHDIVLHRRLGRLHPTVVDGTPVLGVERSFVDAATVLPFRALVQAGDQLVRIGRTSQERLLAFAYDSHLDGVVRAREAALLVRDRVDSPRGTDLRLLLVAAGLPEPEVNAEIVQDGRWLARGDLVFPDLRVLVEHDGWHHERDADQRQKDHLRRERLEAAGWTVVVVTSADFANPFTIVRRVHDAMKRRGYQGHPPSFGRLWHQIIRGL